MKLNLKHSLIASSIAAALGFAGAAHATNGYNLIGIGAYQMGMAGAVVSDPGSAMTAISNPAGMTEVRPQTDFSMEAFLPKRDVNFTATGGQKISSDSNMYGVPALGWSAPTSSGSNVYFGGGMYGTSGMGVDYPYTANGVMPQSQVPPGQDASFNGFSNIALWQMAPALAWKVNDQLSLGVALDIGYMSASFLQSYGFAAAPSPAGGTAYGPYSINMTRSASAFGLGATVGLLYKINPMWTVGAEYTSSQTYKLNYNLAPGDITVPGGASPFAPAGYAFPGGKYTLTMKTPQTASLGVTMNPTSTLAVSAQVKWIDWKDVMNNLSITGPMDFTGFTPKWKSQTVVAVAANYYVTPKFQVRAGYNYAKSPIDSNAVAYNLILPAVVETHYTAGFTYDLNKRWTIGGAYMIAPQKSYTAPMTASMTDPSKGQKVSLSEQAVSFNIGYKF
ncbi:hypothetical protein BJI67_04895 [Acidihalobacter aeolianus]|uniref:Aromatic hydrocarbon degradation protein n=1 Tax=Acidihalobacter aeolianus TaxID=2792603 RepID=A0A1D8K6D2_9GAMM|nr:outer membrane protein transport protein [Acidihalobacter aeolianus]AOV16496.1 hypothetical protein BJI67_04895 [Acidihalobacter aeolianus]